MRSTSIETCGTLLLCVICGYRRQVRLGVAMGTDVLIRLLDRTADAAFASNRDGVICVWNCSAEELFGYSAAEALKMPCSELLSCQSTARAKLCSDQCGVITHCLFGHSVPNFDMKAKLLSGAWIWINVSILVFEREADRDLFVVHLVRDVTQRKELEQLNEQLVKSRKANCAGARAQR